MKINSLETKKISSILNQVKAWSEKSIGCEICGLIGEKDGYYIAELYENESTDPRNSFSIDAIDYLTFVEKNKTIAVFHSHVRGDEKESEKDIIMSENSCLPFLIYSLNTKNFNFYMPKLHDLDVNTITKIEEKI